MSVALNGNDTVILDARILKDLADGDTAVLDFPNDLAGVKVGKNGNTLFAFNSTGQTCTMTIRVVMGSDDDKYLNSRLQEFRNDPPSFILFKAELIKRVGDGEGNIVNNTYKVSGGIITKIPGAKENVEGDTEQTVAIYTLTFANTDRSLA